MIYVTYIGVMFMNYGNRIASMSRTYLQKKKIRQFIVESK